jgi:hypothetical protein
MNWFVAKLVYQIICGDGKHQPQFDEQLKLVKADNLYDGYYAAHELGEMGSETFFNNSQQLVQWKFVAVADLQLLPVLEHGVELHSSITEAEHADDFIAFLHHKSKQIFRSSASISI